MTLPFPTNIQLDLYRGFNPADPYPAPGTPPAVPAVKGFLKNHMRNGRFGFRQKVFWTHKLFVDDAVDVRDGYEVDETNLDVVNYAKADTVLLTDYPLPGWQTALAVMMVEEVRVDGSSYRECWLDRARPQPVGGTTGCPCAVGKTLPDQLVGELHSFGTYPCLDASAAVVLNFQRSGPEAGRWTGSGTPACSGATPLSLAFWCPAGGTGCGDFMLLESGCTATQDHHVIHNPQNGNPCTVSPLEVWFSVGGSRNDNCTGPGGFAEFWIKVTTPP